ncbi:MAG TPA: SDR family oxidoreductase [Candidatus Binataceae bacterium]|jgi:enoyl-[acyl-carrier protein] reductase III|nr:SDR family oxidoreductase [Candidatus Binataceae bacterium]
MGEFAAKVALITGGTRGLGRAIALRLARGGATVALNYRRDEHNARRTLEEVRSLAPRSILAQADLGDDGQVRAMVRRVGETCGRLDIVVANAAATAFRPLLEVKPHNLARTFNLSVGGLVAMVQEAAPLMDAGGRVVIISGIDSIRYTPGHGVLGAAKAALESMVRDLAFELGPRAITVNGVNFALIDSDSSRMYMGEDFERVARAAAARSALGRVPTADEVAAIVCLICSPEAGFLTAQTIMVDGGLSLMSPFVR